MEGFGFIKKQKVYPSKLKEEFFKPLVTFCSEIPIMSKGYFHKDRKFRKSSECLNNKAMLR